MTPSRHQIAIRHGRQRAGALQVIRCLSRLIFLFFFPPNVEKQLLEKLALKIFFLYIKTQQEQMPAIPWEVTFKSWTENALHESTNCGSVFMII